MLGAEGVMMATRFMATKECQVHDNIKQEIVRRQEQDTTLICKSIHLQARALKNRNVEDILAIEKRGGGFEEILPLIMERGSARPGIRAMWTSPPRQFLQLMEKPDVEFDRGPFSAIAIEQKATSHNPRSTVGTVTEIHDYLRLLFARVGDPHCPNTTLS